jgi:hypothetical protein
MEMDGDDHQLLGFIELNGPDLYDGLGAAYGRLFIPILHTFAEGMIDRNTIDQPRKLSGTHSQG